MEACNRPEGAGLGSPDDTLPSWGMGAVDAMAVMEGLDTPPAESNVRLASERPTLPPSRARQGEESRSDEEIVLSRIHLGPSVDEILYRLSLGDMTGAALANVDLEPCTPMRSLTPVVAEAMQLGYLEEFLLAAVDGVATWGEVLDDSPFSPVDSLRALCELVDRGLVTLHA